MEQLFNKVMANENHPNWDFMTSRITPLYCKENDIRSEFERDYTRIIHCFAYRRLKNKTQVFFSPNNDHICTRIEHVTHVESISRTIAKYLGLNTELTKAISVAHDLGHSPFGHEGERILSELLKQDLDTTFWHEKNGLDFVDFIELLEDSKRYRQNLDLTYAVRDGIISHCGEVDENGLKPRENFINLDDYKFPNQFAPYTWEACVVKIADKISYIGRDIEDAISFGILEKHLPELSSILSHSKEKELNNGILIHYFVSDLCENSSPENGLCFSKEAFALMNELKDFNYRNIYSCDRIRPSTRYFKLVLTEIYTLLKSSFDGKSAFSSALSLEKFYPKLSHHFADFLTDYIDDGNREKNKLKNKIIFKENSKTDFIKAIFYYISGMTDKFAIEVYNEIIGF